MAVRGVAVGAERNADFLAVADIRFLVQVAGVDQRELRGRIGAEGRRRQRGHQAIARHLQLDVRIERVIAAAELARFIQGDHVADREIDAAQGDDVRAHQRGGCDGGDGGAVERRHGGVAHARRQGPVVADRQTHGQAETEVVGVGVARLRIHDGHAQHDLAPRVAVAPPGVGKGQAGRLDLFAAAAHVVGRITQADADQVVRRAGRAAGGDLAGGIEAGREVGGAEHRDEAAGTGQGARGRVVRLVAQYLAEDVGFLQEFDELFLGVVTRRAREGAAHAEFREVVAQRGGGGRVAQDDVDVVETALRLGDRVVPVAAIAQREVLCRINEGIDVGRAQRLACRAIHVRAKTERFLAIQLLGGRRQRHGARQCDDKSRLLQMHEFNP